VTPALFLGPLYGRYLSHDLPFMTRWSFNERKNTFGWVGIRNYIVVCTSPPSPYKPSNRVGAYPGTYI
jgi:hypothetical protein